MIYLDNAATTLYKPRAVEQAVRRAMYGAAGYARGGYAAANRAGELVYACREQAAALFGVGEPERVIFTLNATHALNIAINALVRPDSRVIVSGYEHNAVMRPLTARNIEPTVLDTPLWDGAAMVSALKQALAECEADDDVRVVVLAGEGRPSARAATCARYSNSLTMRRRANTYVPRERSRRR